MSFCSILPVLYPLYDFSFVFHALFDDLLACFPPAVLFVYIPQQARRPLPYPIRVILVLWHRLSIHALLISFVWIRSSVGIVVRACYLLLFVCLFLLSMLDAFLPDVMIVLWMWLINTRMIIDAWAVV